MRVYQKIMGRGKDGNLNIDIRLWIIVETVKGKKITSAFIGTFRIHKDKYDHFAIHKNVELLWSIPKTNVICQFYLN